MLHEEVCTILRQVKVGKETVFQMKKQLRRKDGAIASLQNELASTADQCHAFETELRSCENVLQVRVQQNEEL